MSHDPDHFRFSEGRDGTVCNDSPVDNDWRADAPRCKDCGRAIDEDKGRTDADCLAENAPQGKSEPTEDDCAYARYCIENQSTLFDTCKTNADEDALVFELAAILQSTADKWIERKYGR